ncbi:MAG: flagella synthesis protein FlgN [Pseudomonadota bacterium]
MTPLEAALAELHRAMREFHALLEREAAVLQAGQTEALALIVAEKSHWSETANTAWNRLMVASGIDPRRGESLDAVLSAQPALRDTWLDVRRLAEHADKLNHGNNLLIEAQMERTRQALQVLQSAAHRGTLYDASGRIVDGFKSGHTLDKV